MEELKLTPTPTPEKQPLKSSALLGLIDSSSLNIFSSVLQHLLEIIEISNVFLKMYDN